EKPVGLWFWSINENGTEASRWPMTIALRSAIFLSVGDCCATAPVANSAIAGTASKAARNVNMRGLLYLPASCRLWIGNKWPLSCPAASFMLPHHRPGVPLTMRPWSRTLSLDGLRRLPGLRLFDDPREPRAPSLSTQDAPRWCMPVRDTAR